MSKNNYKISTLDLKEFFSVIQSNLMFILGLSLIGFIIGYVTVSSNQNKLKASSFVKFDLIKHQTFLDEFQIDISLTFPEYVNKYFNQILSLEETANVESFYILDGGVYNTKVISVMVESDFEAASQRFSKLYNSILDAFENEVYKEYSLKIENIKHAYKNKKNRNADINALEDILNDKDSSDMLISYLLGMQFERSFSSKEGTSSFVESNYAFEGYKKQLSMNGISVEKPSKLFDRSFLNTTVQPLGSSANLISLVGAVIGFFLSILLTILFKNVRFIK